MEKSDYDKCALEMMVAFKEEPWNEEWTIEEAYTRIDEIMSSRVSRGYCLYDGDLVISMLCGRIMTYMDFKELWIDDFSVHPRYQRHGIGTLMLEYVKNELKKEHEKISYLSLNTEKDYPAYHFYQKNGFKENPQLTFMSKDIWK